ncbi:nectin-1-like isoform X2 [Ambystoma mexicanum]|uniref:nectin-1-like isoform X2 n=1 Tax=Ambystoma mexicanum TaxID=8296 RepID=UPI0037E7B516
MAQCTGWMWTFCLTMTLVTGQASQRRPSVIRVKSEVIGSVMDEVTLHCLLLQGNSDVTRVSWSRQTNGQRVVVAAFEPHRRPYYPLDPHNGRFTFLSTSPSEEASLNIRMLSLSDGGNYHCTFIMSNTTEEAQTRLIVTVKPNNSAHAVPALQSKAEMALVAVCISANGHPPWHISWLSDLFFEATTEEINDTDGTVTVQSRLWMKPAVQANNQTATCVIKSTISESKEHIPVVLIITCGNSTDQAPSFTRREAWQPMVSLWVCIGLLTVMGFICFAIVYALWQRPGPSQSAGLLQQPLSKSTFLYSPSFTTHPEQDCKTYPWPQAQGSYLSSSEISPLAPSGTLYVPRHPERYRALGQHHLCVERPMLLQHGPSLFFSCVHPHSHI